jgi:mannose-6-phosphate isomerase-like protein (cupin superfamily)
MTEQVVEDPVLRQRYVFRRTTAADGAETMEVEVWVQPKGGVVPHMHPTFEERFDVLEGEVTFWVNRKRMPTRAGETAVVPPGARHTYRNTSREPARMLARARPPEQELQDFLEDAAALGRAGLYTRHALPKSLRGLLGLAVMADHYRNTTIILVPPPLLQRILLGPFVRVGKRRGFRPGAYANGGLPS